MTTTRPNFAPTALAIAISLSAANLHAADLPTGGNIVGGSGSISQNGNSLNVQQNSDKLITNWDSFDIGAGHTVNFYQPGSNSVALNRVIGEDASAIYGNLNANGKVFLVNPNGVLFGQGAAVNVGALVASTLSLSDEDFNDGNYQFSGDGNNAAVINRGSITADGGAVALLGGQVSNHGVIQANQGTVALAAGDKITLDFAGDGLLNVTVDEGTIDALVENHQLVRANSGQVIMTANATNALLQTVVNNTGIVEAQTLDNQNGTIVLKGGFNGGTVNVAGTLDASAPNSGDGGFIDTSGAHVKIAGGTQVTTKANNGTTGEWLIDPTDFYITDSIDLPTESSIGAITLSDNLEYSNVTLATADDGTEPGDMYVNGAVSWNADHTLSLNAHNDIHINQAITATNGGLTLNAGGNISANGAVNVGTFNLQSGAWSQLGSNLADFSARDFRLNTANASFLRANGGDGSEGNAYQIFDLYGLQGIASRSLLSSHFALTNDIDASGTANWNGGAGFVPIGDNANHYTGSFDGQGHVINGLTINRPNTDNVGLFGVISASQISNIGLTDATITGRSAVGGLVGNVRTINNRISHSSVQGDIVATSGISGGLAGAFSGTIEHSLSSGTVDSGNYTGGLVGSMSGQITDSYSTATVTGQTNNSGGLVGAMNGNIDRSYATGNVTGTFEYVGGLVGNLNGSVTDSYASGNVLGHNHVGGLVGNNLGTITASHASGNVNSSGSYSGGLVGYNRSTGTISQSYASGQVHGYLRVGGLIGDSDSGGAINQSYATGRVSGSQYIGALVGSNRSTITNSYWNTETSGQSIAVGGGSSAGATGLTTAQMFDAANFTGFDFAGTWANADNQTSPYLRALAGNRVFNKNDLPTGTIGATNRPALYTVIQNVEQLQAMRDNLSANYLLGNPIDATATASWNGVAGFVPVGDGTNRYAGSFDGLGYSISGLTINRPNTDYIGLFAGSVRNQISNVGLTNAVIIGRYYVGGLVGHFESGYIRESYVTGRVSGRKFVGGLLGYSGGSIRQTYSAADVSGSDSFIGGLVGLFEDFGRIEDSYATGQVSGTASSTGGLIGYSYGSITNSYWNTETSGQTSAVGFSSLGTSGMTGLTTAQMLQADSFAGWDIDAQGGTGTVWRIYEGYTAPLLRHFLTALEVTGDTTTTTYNGTEQAGTWSAAGEYDADHIFGQARGGGRNARTYNIDMSGLYSDQQGYDLITTNGTLTINKAKATVTANSGTTTYNGTEQSVDGFTVDGLVNDEDASVLTGVTTSGGKGTNAGNYTLTASGSDGNYELSFVDGKLTINKAQATVTANSGTTTYNGTEQSVDGFTVDGLVNGEDASVLSGVTTSGGKGTNAGSYTLTATGSDGNYELSFVDGKLTINKAQATVTANSGTTTYNGTEQSVDGFTVDGLVNGEDASVLTGVTTSGGKGTNAGNYTLTASGTDGNYELSFVDGKLTINKAQATVTANSGTTTYNGTEQSVDGFTVDGLVNGEDQSVLTGVTTSGGKGTNAGNYALTASGSDGNYELSFVDGKLTINKAQATVTANSGTTTYNGTEQSVDGFTVDGLVNGEDQSVLTGVTTSGGKGTNAGNYALTASGSDGNYELSFVDGKLTINKAQATVTANSGTTTYNGTEQSVDGFTVDGLVNGEDASVLTGVTTSGGKGTNAGNYALTASGSDGNYALSFVDGKLTINKAQATVTANSGTTTYNGTEQSVSGFTVDGLVNGEDASVLTGVTTSGGKGTNAGSYTLTATGSDGNYELSFVDGKLTINKAQATVTANSGTTTYNGTEQSVSGFTVDGLVNGEDASVLTGVTTSGGKGTNAGSYTLTATGSDGNYELSFVDGKLTINKAQATVTANSGTTAYNGTEQSVDGFTVDGLVNGEDASVLSGVTTSGGKGTNAGSYTLTASGSDGNYELSFVDGKLTINKARATVTANSGTTTYNGTEQSVDGFTVDGLVNGEDQSVLTGVTTSGGKGTNAGSYILTASGTDGNYELSFVDGKLTINKAQATVTANSGTTTYNGTEQSVSGFTVDGLVNGEDQSVLTGVTTSGGKGTNAGNYALTASGTDGNYELSFVDGKLTINKAQATVTANSGTTTYNGTEQSVDGFTVDGLVNGEDQSVLTGVTTSGGKGTNAGSYTLTASGTDGNYELSFVNGTLTIERKAITGNITADGKTYDGNTYANTHGTLDGVISGDDLQFNTTGAFADKYAGTGKQVTVSGSIVGGDAGNYVLTTNSSTTANIDRKTITADIRALDKLFDGSLAATLEGMLNGTISGDDVALQLSGLFVSLAPGENRVLVDASLTGADAGNYQLVAPDSVTANMQGFVQSAAYQSAIVSQPPQLRQLQTPADPEGLLTIEQDPLGLADSGR
ncbi:MBG domain-containing protein [Pseudomonas abyssi]|uniref:MBG domain-containing protein n=1 Tax=Pseudomonas abyssi TaxID=170540 RepID=UPI003C79E717